MKHAVGDEVKIKSLKWYNSLKKNEDGDAYIPNDNDWFLIEMKRYCGETATITVLTNGYYHIDLDKFWHWTDEMFED